MAKRTASAVRWFLFCGTRCTPHVSVFYKVEDGHNKAQKLAAATAYGSSDRGDNYYVHTVERDGVSSTIEFSYSTDWQYNVGDWAQVLTKSYVVYMPEDYDGLVFAAEAQPDNYKDSAKRMQLDSIAPEAAIMDIPTLDPHGNLYFAICG